MMSDANKRNVLVLYTGGTLGMQAGEDGSLVCKTGLAEMMAGMPELSDPAAPNYTVFEFDPLLDSSSMTPKDWETIAATVEKHYYDYDGFVVIHGTDTMAYTASALSYMLENLGKIVVVTGSQLPLLQAYSDARQNLVLSLLFAAHVDVPEVCVLFNNVLLRGCRAKKVDATSTTAFTSPNFPPLATIGTSITLNRQLFLKPPIRRFQCRRALKTKIVALHMVPGFDDGVIRAAASEADALILLLYGTGNAPSERKEFIDILKTAIDSGTVVVAVSQCDRGSVNLNKYKVGSVLHNIGVLPAGDMTIEATSTKLAYLMGMGMTGRDLKGAFNSSLRGERTTASSTTGHDGAEVLSLQELVTASSISSPYAGFKMTSSL